MNQPMTIQKQVRRSGSRGKFRASLLMLSLAVLCATPVGAQKKPAPRTTPLLVLTGIIPWDQLNVPDPLAVALQYIHADWAAGILALRVASVQPDDIRAPVGSCGYWTLIASIRKRPGEGKNAVAALLSVAGSIAGLILGEIGSFIIGRIYPTLPVGAPWWAVLAAFGTALGTGILFSVWPARRASRLWTAASSQCASMPRPARSASGITSIAFPSRRATTVASSPTRRPKARRIGSRWTGWRRASPPSRCSCSRLSLLVGVRARASAHARANVRSVCPKSAGWLPEAGILR